MKFKYLFFSMIVAGFLTSAMTVEKKLEVGMKAPKIENHQGINVGYDANSETKERVISFWSPKHPASRIANKNLYKQYADNADMNVDFISVCTDSDEALMKEVMKIDGIRENVNYSYSSIPPRVFKDYGVEQRPRAFKINAEGRIVEIL